MKSIDPLQVQRLVDSELDDVQVQQMLTDAKETPEHWREIAIGFIENQTWSRAFRNRDASSEFRGGHDSVVSHAKSSKTHSSQWSPNYSRLAMATSVMLAATIGYMLSQIQNRSLPVSSIENVPPVSSPLLAEDASATSQDIRDSFATGPQLTQADYHLEVPQEHLGDLASAGPVAPVPLFPINNVEQLNQFTNQTRTPAISPEVLRQFAGSGYQMEQDVNYISGRLGDGRSFVVPIRTIRFRQGQ